ncbi:substrate-binding domain-containing protein [Janthinobacterium sp. RB2R34]
MAACLMAGALLSPYVTAAPITIGLIIKNETNPFFQKMKEGAVLGATVHGARLITSAGKADDDTQSQIDAISDMVAQGVKTILITPTGAAVSPAIRDARAKGVQVIALDSPTQPPDAANSLFGTNNYQAGILIGQYAKQAMQKRYPGQPLKVATLDLLPGNPTGAQRHNGFMSGLGLKADGAESTALSTAPEIVCMGDSYGDRSKGHDEMVKCLQSNGGINLVYTINEPAAAGAFEALKAAGKERNVLIVSVDGGCPGIRLVESGAIGATAQQYPLTMAAMGVDAGVAYAKRGVMTAGYVDTGVSLISAKALPGVPSRSVQAGLEACFGPK